MHLHEVPNAKLTTITIQINCRVRVAIFEGAYFTLKCDMSSIGKTERLTIFGRPLNVGRSLIKQSFSSMPALHTGNIEPLKLAKIANNSLRISGRATDRISCQVRSSAASCRWRMQCFEAVARVRRAHNGMPESRDLGRPYKDAYQRSSVWTRQIGSDFTAHGSTNNCFHAGNVGSR
jgi:hypothetical protein